VYHDNVVQAPKKHPRTGASMVALARNPPGPCLPQELPGLHPGDSPSPGRFGRRKLRQQFRQNRQRPAPLQLLGASRPSTEASRRWASCKARRVSSRDCLAKFCCQGQFQGCIFGGSACAPAKDRASALPRAAFRKASWTARFFLSTRTRPADSTAARQPGCACQGHPGQPGWPLSAPNAWWHRQQQRAAVLHRPTGAGAGWHSTKEPGQNRVRLWGLSP
jgi:hypothetical protein